MVCTAGSRKNVGGGKSEEKTWLNYTMQSCARQFFDAISSVQLLFCSNSHVFFCLKPCAGTQQRSAPKPVQYTTHTVFVLLKMGIMMPETCWDRSLIINIWLLHLVSFLSLHTLPKMHGHRNLKHGYLFAEMVKVYWFTKLSHNDFQFPPFNTTKRVSNAETNIIFLDFLK